MNVQLIWEELRLDGSVIIGKRRKDGKWDARTYVILKELRELASKNGIAVEFDKEDGAATLIEV